MIFEKIRGRLQKKWQSYMDEYGMIDIKIQEVFVEIRNIINQVETEYNNGWIPCSEKLPENANDYLVTQYNQDAINEYCNGYRVATIFFDDKGWWDDIDNDWGWKIIAWQPLPQPPKGE